MALIHKWAIDLKCDNWSSFDWGRFWVVQTFKNIIGVAQAGHQLFATAVALKETYLEGAEITLTIDKSHGIHQRTENNLSVVSEKVDLRKEWTEN